MLVIVLATWLLVSLHMHGGDISNVAVFHLMQKYMYNHITHLESIFLHFSLLVHLCYYKSVKAH